MANNTIALGSRAHIFAHPDMKDRITKFFTDILGCEVVALPGTPVIAIRFPNSTMSVEFTEDALDDQQARRGAWLEVKPDDPAELKDRIMAAGLPKIVHLGSDRFYFQAPGGQVWGIVE